MAASRYMKCRRIPQLKCLVAPCGLISFSFGKGNRLVEVIEVIPIENNPYSVESQLALAFELFSDIFSPLDQCTG